MASRNAVTCSRGTALLGAKGLIRARQRLRGVDVSQPRDEPLIEERGLDRTTPSSQLVGELRGGPLRIGGVGTEPEIERDTGGMQIDRAERARIDEDQRSCIVEIDRGTREARKIIGGLHERPIAIHAEVSVQHAPIVEMQQLMFAATFDAYDSRTGERVQLRWSEPALQRRMQQSHAYDRASGGARAEEFQGGFHLGQLGHQTFCVVWTASGWSDGKMPQRMPTLNPNEINSRGAATCAISRRVYFGSVPKRSLSTVACPSGRLAR